MSENKQDLLTKFLINLSILNVYATQKMKFSIEVLHLLKKPLMKNFVFCALLAFFLMVILSVTKSMLLD